MVVVIVTFVYNKFGYNPCEEVIWWCWVEPALGDTAFIVILWQLLAGKAFELASYLAVSVLYAVVKIKLARHACIPTLTLYVKRVANKLLTRINLIGTDRELKCI